MSSPGARSAGTEPPESTRFDTDIPAVLHSDIPPKRELLHVKPTILDTKPLVATDESRDEVAAMAAHGLGPTEIAAVLKADPRDVKRVYADEIAHGLALATAKVGGMLYKKARLGDTKAAIFWLQARAGWRIGAQAPTSPQPEAGQAKTDVVGRILAMLTPAQLVQAVTSEPLLPKPDVPPSGSRH